MIWSAVSDKAKAAWFLALLSPMVAELLSGSAPPLEFFSPFGILLLVPMYGGGALLVRELTVRWGKGWATVIMLGAAYGVIEEGIAVKSFFDPGWVDLGSLGEYGRMFEVNWVWSAWLTVYHSMVSISLPILILGIWYPWTKGQSILSWGEFRLVAFLFVLDIAVCALLFTELQEYTPPLLQYAGCFAVVYALIWMAKKAPRDLVGPRHPVPTWSPGRFLLLGLGTLTLSFVISSSAPSWLPFPIVIALLMTVVAGSLLLLQHKLGATGNVVHASYLAVGLMLLFILLGPIHEMGGMTGMSLVSLAFALFSVQLVKRASAQSEAHRAAPPSIV